MIGRRHRSGTVLRLNDSLEVDRHSQIFTHGRTETSGARRLVVLPDRTRGSDGRQLIEETSNTDPVVPEVGPKLRLLQTGLSPSKPSFEMGDPLEQGGVGQRATDDALGELVRIQSHMMQAREQDLLLDTGACSAALGPQVQSFEERRKFARGPDCLGNIDGVGRGSRTYDGPRKEKGEQEGYW